MAARAAALEDALGHARFDQIQQRLGGVGMPADGDDGVAKLVGGLDHAFEFRAVLLGAERGLVRLEVDGEGKDRALIQSAAGTQRFDLLADGLGAEAVLALDGSAREVVQKQRRSIVQAGGKQAEAVLGVSPSHGKIQRRFLKRFEAMKAPLLRVTYFGGNSKISTHGIDQFAVEHR